MNRDEKANFILSTLDGLFPNPESQLEFYDPFTQLIAVMLSVQCTDVTVNKVTKELFGVATTPSEILGIGKENLKEIIHPCGLFNMKADAIVNTSRMILEKFEGQVPSTFEELESLPGVGHKTASVMISQCFNLPAFPVDTHIARLSNRWGLSESLNVKKIESDLKEIFPKKTWKNLHLQLILYGRSFCPSRNHILSKCPICEKFNRQ